MTKKIQYIKFSISFSYHHFHHSIIEPFLCLSVVGGQQEAGRATEQGAVRVSPEGGDPSL